jgi:hypothetical protein
MASGKLHPAHFYYEYPDKQIVAYPLGNVAQTWSTMVYLLEKPGDMRRQTDAMRRIQTNRQYAQRYIASAIKNLFVFEFDQIVDYLFRVPTNIEVVQTNLTNHAWTNIKANYLLQESDLLACSKCLLAIKGMIEQQPLYFLSKPDAMIQQIKPLIKTRPTLSFVFSILASNHASRLGDLWFEVLSFLADDTVSPLASDRIHSKKHSLILGAGCLSGIPARLQLSLRHQGAASGSLSDQGDAGEDHQISCPAPARRRASGGAPRQAIR